MSAPKRKRDVQLNFRVSPEELAGGETYVTLMEGNLERLRERMT